MLKDEQINNLRIYDMSKDRSTAVPYRDKGQGYIYLQVVKTSIKKTCTQQDEIYL